jgi:hypothetical protein
MTSEMKPSWLLASLLLACLAGLSWIYFAKARVVAPVEHTPSANIAEQRPTSVPRSALETAKVESSPTSSTARTPAPDESNEPSSHKLITFRFESGEPAAGLGLYRADVAMTVYDRAITNQRPNWSLRLGSRGELPIERASELGRFIAVRLSDVAVELMPFEPSRQLEYVLPTVVDQPITLAGLPSREGISIELALERLESCTTGSAIDYKNKLDGVAFADRFSFEVRTLDSLCTAAYSRLHFDSDHPSGRLRLPTGDYGIAPLHAAVGWWMNYATVHVDGTPINLPLVQVPVTQVLLRHEANGEIWRPDRVRILIVAAPHDGFAGSSSEVELDFENEGDHLKVGETYRNTGEHESFTTYALKFYWPDGSATTTKVGPWESLLQTVDLSGS